MADRVYSIPKPGKLMRKRLESSQVEDVFSRSRSVRDSSDFSEARLSQSQLERELLSNRRQIIFSDLYEDGKKKRWHHDNMRRHVQSFYSESRISKESRKALGIDKHNTDVNMTDRANKYETLLPSLTRTSFPEKKNIDFFVDDTPIIDLEKRLDEIFLTANNVHDDVHMEMHTLHALSLNYVLYSKENIQETDTRTRSKEIDNLTTDIKDRLQAIIPDIRGRKNPNINDKGVLKSIKDDLAVSLLSDYLQRQPMTEDQIVDDITRMQDMFNVEFITESQRSDENLKKLLGNVFRPEVKTVLKSMKDNLEVRALYDSKKTEIDSYETFDDLFGRISFNIKSKIESNMNLHGLPVKKKAILDGFKEKLYQALDTPEFYDTMRISLHENEDSIKNIITDMGYATRGIRSYTRTVASRKIEHNLSEGINKIYSSLERKSTEDLEDTIERLACTVNEDPEKFNKFGIMKNLLSIVFDDYHDFDSNKEQFSRFRRSYRESSDASNVKHDQIDMDNSERTRYLDRLNYELLKVPESGCDPRSAYRARNTLGSILYSDKNVIVRSTMDDDFYDELVETSKGLLRSIYSKATDDDVDKAISSLRDTLRPEVSSNPRYDAELFKSKMVLCDHHIREKGVEFSGDSIKGYARELKERYLVQQNEGNDYLDKRAA